MKKFTNTSWFSISTSVTTQILREWSHIHEIFYDATTPTTDKAASLNLNLNVNSLSPHSVLVLISHVYNGREWWKIFVTGTISAIS